MDNTTMNNDEGMETPLDSIISRVESYIQDPKLVTPETLMDLKSELEDLKVYVEGEEQPEPEEMPMKKTMGKIMGAVATLAILFFFAKSPINAELAKNVYGFAYMGQHTSEAIAYSSSTCVGTPNPASTIISPNASSELYVISITSAGSSDSYFQVFDASGTTLGGSIPGSTTTARVVSNYVSAAAVRDVFYNVMTSTGILVNINGATKPCIDIKYNSK